MQISMKLNHVTGEKGVFVSDVSPGGAAERLVINNSFLKVKVSLISNSVMHLFFKVCFLKKTLKCIKHLTQSRGEVNTSCCHGSKICGSQQTMVLQIWQIKKKLTYNDFPVRDYSQEQNDARLLFFFCLTMQMTVSVEKYRWDPEILLP